MIFTENTSFLKNQGISRDAATKGSEAWKLSLLKQVDEGKWITVKKVCKLRLSLHTHTTDNDAFSVSMITISPSLSNPIGPPTWASGDTWPIIMPWEAPLNLPSVTKATLFPSPAPTKAPLGDNISGIPGLRTNAQKTANLKQVIGKVWLPCLIS